MKSQRKTIESDWEGGKPFLHRSENEEVSIDENYYVGRQHLFDPKAKRPNDGSFFYDNRKALVLWAVSIFAIVSLLRDGGIGGNIGISVFMFIIIVAAMKFAELSDASKNSPINSSSTATSDMIDRELSIYTVDKLFTNDRLLK